MLLFRHFSQRRSLATALERVQLLVLEEQVVTYARAKTLISSLRDDVDHITVWGMGNYPTEPVEKQLQLRSEAHNRLRQTIRTLQGMCMAGTSSNADDNVNDKSDSGNKSDSDEQDVMNGAALKEVNASTQVLLCELGAHDVIMRALRVPGRRTDDLYAEWRRVRTIEFNGILQDMKRCCYEFLTIFARDNPKTQAVLYPKVNAFMLQVEDGPHVTEAIGNVFRNNSVLSSKIPERLFWNFASCIDDQVGNRSALTYIDFFISVATISVPATINQSITLKVMTHSSFTRVSRLRFPPGQLGAATTACEILVMRTGMGLIELQTRLMDQSENQKHAVGALNLSDKEQTHIRDIIYHAKCLELFSMVCTGKHNVNLRGQAKCRQLLPLQELLGLLLSGTKMPFLDTKRAQFLDIIFFDCM